MAHHQPNRIKNTVLFSALFIVGYAAFALYLSKSPAAVAHAKRPSPQPHSSASAKVGTEASGGMTTAARHRYALAKQGRMGRRGSGITVAAKGPQANILEISFPGLPDARMLAQLKGQGRFHKEIERKGFEYLVLRNGEKTLFRKKLLTQ